MLKWIWLAVVVVVLDQASKQVAITMLHYQQPVVVLPFFNLTLSYNTGAAFSFLSNAGGWQRWLFVVLAAVASVVLIVWMSRLTRRDVWLAASMAMILGGALGNLIDRIWRDGRVVDFIQLYYHHWYWPTFNLADSAITVGVTFLLIDGIFGRRSKGADS